MSEDIKKPHKEVEQKPEELPTEALDKVTGGTKTTSGGEGKASFHDISFVHNVDKSSPVL